MSGKSATRAERYADSLRRNLAAELSTDALLCPKCGDGWVLPDTKAGRMGVCPACWNRALAEAQRLATKEIEAQREYESARKRKSEAMRKSRDAKRDRVADSGRR